MNDVTARPAVYAGILIVAASTSLTCMNQVQADVPADSGEIGRVRYDFQRRANDRLRVFTVTSYEQFVADKSAQGSQPTLTLKGGISYDEKSWLRLEAGVGTYYTWRKTVNNLFELRLWQAATFDWPQVDARTRWVVHHRFMLEERFQYAGDWDTNLRGRYRLSTTVPINAYTVAPGTLYLPLEAELFWSQSNSDTELFTNKAELGLGLGYQVSKSWAMEIRYIWQDSRDTVGADFSRDNNIFELRFKSTIRIRDYLKSR